MARLKTCVCGLGGGRAVTRAGLALTLCECGVLRSAEDMQGVELQYRTGDYHRSTTRHAGCQPYAERYQHDLQIAAQRWQRYGAVLGPRLEAVRSAVDVGCGNGAFVDFLAALRIESWGVEPAPEFGRERVATGTLSDFVWAESLVCTGQLIREVDLITFHDVLEHVVEPLEELQRAVSLLGPRGLVIVDVPDVFGGAGEHHLKSEHLWYYSHDALVALFRRAGLTVIGRDQPIPGKLVLYGEGR